MSDAESLFAWVTEDPDGSIGQVGMLVGGMHTMLCSRSRAVAERMRPMAAMHGQASGQRVWLRRYQAAEDLEDA